MAHDVDGVAACGAHETRCLAGVRRDRSRCESVRPDESPPSSRRARPWKTVTSRPALPYTAEDRPDEAHTHDAGDADEPALVYFCDNPSERQRFFAPCWLIVPPDEDDHHARRCWPASDHTVLPEIVVQIGNGTGVVTAEVLSVGQRIVAVEHGDEWQLRWAVANLREFIAGERSATEGSSAALDGAGIHQVGLEVEHVATGAVRSTHTQESAIAAPDSTQTAAVPLPQA